MFSTHPSLLSSCTLLSITVAAHEANSARDPSISFRSPICLPPEAATLDDWQQTLLLLLRLYPCQLFFFFFSHYDYFNHKSIALSHLSCWKGRMSGRALNATSPPLPAPPAPPALYSNKVTDYAQNCRLKPPVLVPQTCQSCDVMSNEHIGRLFPGRARVWTCACVTSTWTKPIRPLQSFMTSCYCDIHPLPGSNGLCSANVSQWAR